MSQKALQKYLTLSVKQKSYDSFESAEKELFQIRDDALTQFHKIAKYFDLNMDYSHNSLKPLEKWRYDILSQNDFSHVGGSISELDRLINYYYYELLIRNLESYIWKVAPIGLVKDKYCLYANSGLCSIAAERACMETHYSKNKRMNSMWRAFNVELKREIKSKTPSHES